MGVAWSLVYAVIAMLVCRGLLTLFKRWLILSERIAPENDPDERTLETNRALFWRRMRSLAILFGIYFAIYFVFYGLGPLEALDALPGVIAAAIPQLAYFLVIMVANFMLFFGAFFIYGRIGRNYVDPGEANYEVKIEDVRGQKSAVEEMRRMFGGGQLGLNTLLVMMDGVDNPGYFKQMGRRMVNITLDGLFLPRQIGVNGSKIKLRVPILRAPRYNILFVGATNRPQVLDEAVVRPGRFCRQIIFRMPTQDDRQDIPDLYFAKKKHDPELDTPARRDEFARVADGYSPAMIEQALSLALMYAFQDNRDAFTWRDIREAMGNIEAGLAHPVVYTDRERVAVARNELGHAVAARYFLPVAVSERLSIRMRAGSLGHHRAVDKEEEFSKFRSHAAGELRPGLGAIASERVFYGEHSTGVSMDLIQSTDLASRMIVNWGMGPDPLPPHVSRLAVSIGEYLISAAASVQSELTGGASPAPEALQNPRSRQALAQVLGSAAIDDWRVLNVNKEAIDLAAEALMAQGELVGDEIGGVGASVGRRAPHREGA